MNNNDTLTALVAKRDALSPTAPYAQTRDLDKQIDALVLADLGPGVGVMEYDSNNSGGSWWLKDADWIALENAGWTVHWGSRVYGNLYDVLKPVERPLGAKGFLGAQAMSCAKAGTDADALIAEFERVAGQDASDEGCNCCGQPHSFEWHAPDGTTASPSLIVSTRLSW